MRPSARQLSTIRGTAGSVLRAAARLRSARPGPTIESQGRIRTRRWVMRLMSVAAATAIVVAASAPAANAFPTSTFSIWTVAGSGAGCGTLCGDGGPATLAAPSFPEEVALDGAGALFIADTFNGAVRRVTPAGIISTVAGGGPGCLSTDPCGDGGPATSATLSFPFGLAFDGAGNLYIADSSAHRIRKVTGTTISTVAGSGNACSPTTSACGDTGPAVDADLNFPSGIALDDSGNLYIADAGSNRVRKVTGTTISTVA